MTGLEGIPDATFQGEEIFIADEGTVGNLTEGYLKNTESLAVVNTRLFVICSAYEIEDCGPQ